MYNKYQGETIAFQGVAEDSNGTGLTTAVGSLNITDYTGSTVFSGVGTHGVTGTYQHVASTSGWGTGPVDYQWTFFHSSGTNTVVADNSILIVGTSANPDSYIKLEELDTYYAQIGDYVDDKSESHIQAAYNHINRWLDNLNYKTPIEIGPDGLYDESLRSMNAHLAIYRIVSMNEVARVEGDENPWYLEFRKRAMDILKEIEDGKITFRREKAPSDTGISIPVRTVGSSVGILHNNWDRSYGEMFQGSDYPRTWVIEVLGTGTSGRLADSTFRWSKDNMVSWETFSNAGTVGTCGHDWYGLDWEVYVRFDMGSSTGTDNILVTGEQWKFNTAPIKGQKGGKGFVNSYW